MYNDHAESVLIYITNRFMYTVLGSTKHSESKNDAFKDKSHLF